ncbi:hypothetical protein Tco_0144384 [Tanacetum coccineum]
MDGGDLSLGMRDHVDLGQDGLGVFDWSEEADNAPIALALMATSSTDSSNSKVPYCSKCSKSYKKLLESYQTERDNFQRARTEILGYQMSLESLEVMLKTHEKNEYAWGDKYEQMEYDLKIRDLKLEEKQKELDQWYESDIPSGMNLDRSFGMKIFKEKSIQAVPPPTGTIIPPRANVSFTGIDELPIMNKGNPEEDLKDYAIIDMVALEIVFQDTQTDCIQDSAQKMKLKRLKASIATMSRQTDAEQRRPTIKKLEVKQVEFKLGEDCWEIQV